MVLNSSLLMRGDIWQSQKDSIEFKSSVVIALTMIMIVMMIFTIIGWLRCNRDRAIGSALVIICILVAYLGVRSFNAWHDAKDLENKEVIHPVSLTEIKDFIKVEGNKLIIEPVNRLPHNSKYIIRSGSRDENQNIILKIEEDQFYDTMQLVSRNGEEFELDNDEIQMIKSKRQQ